MRSTLCKVAMRFPTFFAVFETLCGIQDSAILVKTNLTTSRAGASLLECLTNYWSRGVKALIDVSIRARLGSQGIPQYHYIPSHYIECMYADEPAFGSGTLPRVVLIGG